MMFLLPRCRIRSYLPLQYSEFRDQCCVGLPVSEGGISVTAETQHATGFNTGQTIATHDLPAAHDDEAGAIDDHSAFDHKIKHRLLHSNEPEYFVFVNLLSTDRNIYHTENRDATAFRASLPGTSTYPLKAYEHCLQACREGGNSRYRAELRSLMGIDRPVLDKAP
jgi:hypothetical protein